MKKFLLVLFISLTTYSCKERQKYSVEEQIMIDSISNALLENSKKQIWLDGKTEDTIGISTSPLKVMSAKVVKSNGGSYRNIELRIKNLGNKTINAYKIKWRGENAFMEPADMGSFLDGYGGGWSDRPIKPNQTSNLTWNVLSKDAKDVEAWPIELVFEDGSKWDIKDYQ